MLLPITTTLGQSITRDYSSRNSVLHTRLIYSTN